MINLYEINRQTGEVELHFHKGQWKAFESNRRIVAVFAGTQSGKTSWLPWWLHREIQLCGPGDYLAVTSTFDLFKLKFLPALRDVFENVLRIGRFWAGDRVIELLDPYTGRFWANRSDDPMYARIICRSAQASSGLESTTAKAAILDESGQKQYTIETWEAIKRRLALYRGRCCMGTTIYNFGWLKDQIYDKWKEGSDKIDVIQFDSTVNPSFSSDEYYEAMESMPLWRFNMFYRGLFERPAGLIYDSFNETFCKIKRFEIPLDWKRYFGLDFGGVNTAGMFYARNPDTGQYVAYRQYHAGNRTAKEHVTKILENEPVKPITYGGAGSEDQWRREFNSAGLFVHEPDTREVEIGITRVYGAHKRNQILVFDDLDLYLREKKSYSRVLDDAGNPTDEIEDKNKYHLMDAERYIMGYLCKPKKSQEAAAGGPRTTITGTIALPARGMSWQPPY